jgi:uncharacterized membrane protein YedE/YeeE
MDWIWGLVGGLMIGTAAATFLLLRGRVMGASGILAGALTAGAQRLENIAFVAGLVGLPLIIALSLGAPASNLTASPFLLVLGGLAVGLGTRLANGCTSGHGVCGISRFSVRGIVATLAYLGAGFAAMAVLRHGLGVL